MTFRAQPSDDHLYATFHSCVKGVAGLKIVIDYLDRIDRLRARRQDVLVPDGHCPRPGRSTPHRAADDG
eukprot:1158079-Heterocapsa_arctica.AAC.1